MKPEEMRRLDAVIAEARGYRVAWRWLEQVGVPHCPGHAWRYSETYVAGAEPIYKSSGKKVPLYSTDGNAMDELRKNAVTENWNVTIRCRLDGMACVTIRELINFRDWKVIGFAGCESIAEAFARAYYEAKTGKEWSE